jgi:hypothetical protein
MSGMTRTDITIAIASVAALQHGTISRAQAIGCGAGDSFIMRRVRSGDWVRLHPGVFAVAGAPATYERDQWAGFLALGARAVQSHEVALYVEGVTRVPRWPLTFTVPHGGHVRLAGIFAHQIDDLEAWHVMTSPIGLPMSTPARALVEVAATLRPRHLADVVDDAVIELRLTTYVRISSVLHSVLRPGKPGMAKMAEILTARLDEQPVVGSVAEQQFFEALSAQGVPLPRRQVALPGRGPVEGVVDGLYAFERVITEVDGRTWHSRIRARAIDAARDLQALRNGYQPLRVPYELLVDDPDQVVSDVAAVLAVRRELMIAAGHPVPHDLPPLPDLRQWPGAA